MILFVFYAWNKTTKLTITNLTVPAISDIVIIKNFRFFSRQTLEKT